MLIQTFDFYSLFCLFPFPLFVPVCGKTSDLPFVRECPAAFRTIEFPMPVAVSVYLEICPSTHLRFDLVNLRCVFVVVYINQVVTGSI